MASTPYYLYLLVFFGLFSYTLQDDACQILGCGEGRCVADGKRLSYHCECNRGWKTMMVAPMPFPSCIVPNCTMNFSCGSRAPPPPPYLRPPFNTTNVCNLVWCGEGDCVADETRHYCRCHDDADNLHNNSSFICIRQCAFKADCNHLGIGRVSPPSGSPPPPSKSANSLGRGQLPVIVVLLAWIVMAMT
ncbi:hypothetical protein L1987_49612 [Smallanthus sonchifolius]|uniref:Uncharacterized protein n=1 Tax=Smallanthus sonchifolius TaxID=185202 RepID=A0ACB9FUK7_9ASTR|nr:hypothetical protein L1987_49612 [Smallanthus sonchifolius]